MEQHYNTYTPIQSSITPEGMHRKLFGLANLKTWEKCFCNINNFLPPDKLKKTFNCNNVEVSYS